MVTSVTYSVADSWALPDAKEFDSENKEFRFLILPRTLENQYEYFKDLVDGKKKPGAPIGGEADYCKGILFKQDEQGFYQVLWQTKLVNDVAPVNALVSNDGNFVVTFDNWYSIGYGDDVVVVYGEGGGLIKKYALEELVSKYEVEKMQKSTTSRYWGGEHYIEADRERLILQIAFYGAMFDTTDDKFREIRIDLTTGQIAEEDYILPGSDKSRIFPEGLSLVQLERAKDEIYARHGYKFSDREKQKYFETKGWYQENPDFSLGDLTEIENKNLERLSKLLKLTTDYEPDSIMFTKPYEDYWIVYTYGISGNTYKPFDYRYCLYILPQRCDHENLDSVCVYKALITDAGSPLQIEQIQIRDIHNGFENYSKPEILIYRSGPSSDFSQICIGQNAVGEIVRYYFLWNRVADFQMIDSRNVLIRSIAYLSYYARYEEFIFDSEVFSLRKLEENKYDVAFLTVSPQRLCKTTTKNPLTVYRSPGLVGYEVRGDDYSVFEIPPGDSVSVLKFHNMWGGVFLIEYDQERVWASEDDVKQNLHLIFAD